MVQAWHLVNVVMLVFLLLPVVAAQAEVAEDRVRILGEPVLLSRIPTGSWCAGAARLLEEGAALDLVAGVRIEHAKSGVVVTGPHKKLTAPRRGTKKFKPVLFPKPRLGPPSLRVSKGDLRKGLVFAVPSAGGSQVAFRVEANWEGIGCGVVSGFRFPLDDDSLVVVDADLDGKPTDKDRVLYGDRHVWMPWHTVTAGKNTIYHEMRLEGGVLVASTRPMDDRGGDDGEFQTWNSLRKDHGVPPGIFDAKAQQSCVLHAKYLEQNDLFCHDEDSSLPGFTPEGRRAGLSSCITRSGRAGAIQEFLRSIYHRPMLIDPQDAVLQLGGHGQIFLLGYCKNSSKPSEFRRQTEPQMHPAPGTSLTNGNYEVESPRHPALDLPGVHALGLPIMLRFPTSLNVVNAGCRLFRVRGDLRRGRRAEPVRCHLSYPNHGVPQGYSHLWNMIVLTPLEPLSKGVYQADFKLKANASPVARRWRFEITRS